MNPFMIGMGMALWFGILTSISPCPLATNIAAVSYIGRQVDRAGYLLSAGFLYMFGRMITYVLLGASLVSSAQSIPIVANFLQKYMNILLGPVLIIIGIILLDIIKINTGGIGFFANTFQVRIQKTGIWGAGVLGMVFALSFCPVSAALFFGSLFSLAINHDSKIIMPSLYGIGTAIPVLGFAFLLALSTKLVGKAYDKIAKFELWARKITAIVFIVAGIFYCLRYLLHWL
ncbi:sulfite exporter TauE/SafE family protein [Candidatus Woesebacteria bacterium]|nr:MAG: sulfite exporter TauE/SafE family protein [Candidatus Woesebacteria bacterium]